MNAALHSPDARAVSQAPGATHGISSSGRVQAFAYGERVPVTHKVDSGLR